MRRTMPRAISHAAGVGALAQGLKQVGAQLSQEQQEDEAAAASEADLAYSSALQQVLYDPTEGYLTTARGRDAMSQREGLRSRIKELKTQYGQSLTEGARERYEKMAEQRAQSAFGGIDRHAATQRQSWLTSIDDADIANAQQELRLGLSDVEMREVALAKIRAANERKAARRGDDPEFINALGLEAESNALRDVIDEMSTRDPASAMQLMRNLQSEMTAEDVAALSPRLAARKQSYLLDLADEFDHPDQLRDATKPGGKRAGFFKWLDDNEAGDDGYQAQNKVSSASGRGQFMRREWNEYRRKNPEAARYTRMADAPEAIQDQAIDWLMSGKEKALKDLGIEPTNSNLAIAWRYGQGMVKALRSADPNESAASVFRRNAKKYKNVEKVISGNRLEGKTIGRVLREFDAIEEEKVTADPRFSDMSRETLDKAVTKLDRKNKRRLAENKRLYENMAEEVRSGIRPLSEAPAREELIAEYGAEVGGGLADGFESAALDYDAVSTIAAAPLSEARDTVLESARAVTKPGGDYQSEVKRAQAFQQAFQKRVTAIQKDPAIAAADDPHVQEIQAQLAENFEPSGVKKLMNAQLAAQDAAEVTMVGVAPRPLTVAQARAFAGLLEDTPPEQMAGTLFQFRDALGDDFNVFASQLISDGKMSGDIVTMSIFSDDQSAIRVLDRARRIDAKEVSKTLTSYGVASKDYEEPLAERLDELRQAMSADDPSGPRFRAFQDIQATLRHAVAVELARSPDMDINRAIETVVGSTVDSGFVLHVDGKHKVMASADAVEADQLETAIDLFTEGGAISEFVPAHADEEVQAELHQRFLERDGYFVTSGDGRGVVMVVDINGIETPIRDQDGEPYGFQFSDVPKIVANAPVQKTVIGARAYNPDAFPKDPDAVSFGDASLEAVRQGAAFFQKYLHPEVVGAAGIEAASDAYESMTDDDVSADDDAPYPPPIMRVR